MLNKDIIAGKWKQIKGSVKTRWAALNDDDLLDLDGHRDRLIGTIQERYGIARATAEQQVRKFERRIN
ncbi:MAG TPA: CsbD family protein [Rhodocyclaceae bacterium]|nr:CsbD family protein [Rhodocyclaceae bacterium]